MNMGCLQADMIPATKSLGGHPDGTWLTPPAEYSQPWLPQAENVQGLCVVLALCTDDFSFHLG